MALANEYMLEELTAEEIYQKKLTAGTNITIDNQNVISATGGGSSVQYTSNYAQGDILGTLNIDGASSAIRTPNLVEGENITITRNQQAGTITISSSAGSGDLSANELTEEAYNALTPAQKTNGDLYLTHPATVGSSEPNKIYYNNTLYGTEGGNDVVELTQAEWDALPSSKLTDGIIYVITDGGGGGGASAISDLTDVELTNLADKEILEWDAVAEKWKNKPNSGGGGTGGSSVYTCDLLIDQTIKAVGNYNFSKDISEYDAVVIAGDAWRQSSSSDNKSMGITMFIPKEDYLTRYVQDGWGFAFTYQSQRTTFNIDVTNNCLEVGYVDVASNPAYINKVYGLKFGTLSPIIYSEEEREVGVWIDNKPLYAKTYDIPSITISSAGTAIPNIDISVVDTFVNGYGVSQEYGQVSPLALYNYNGLNAASNINISVDKIWIQYTKTTDVAGSGKYNTLGVPMTHIDESEQVIGTLFGETLYQKSFQTTVTIASTARAWYTLLTSSQLRIINADKVLIDATHSFIELNDSIINLNYSSIVNAAGGTAGCSYASTEDEVQVCLYGFVAGTYPATVTIQYTKTTD